MKQEETLYTEISSISLAYLRLALARLDIRIRQAVQRARALGRDPNDPFQGLYVADADVDAWLAEPGTISDGQPAFEDELESGRMVAHLREQAATLAREAAQTGQVLPLVHLAELFGLSEWEQDVVLVTVAPEIDLRYERLYAFLQDDVTKKRPTVDLALNLLCTNLADRLRHRAAFLPDSPLLRWELVELYEDPGARRAALLGRYLKLNDRIAAYLLGQDALDARLADICELPRADQAEAVPYPDSLAARLGDWAAAIKPLHLNSSAPLLFFHGPYGSGRRAAARALATEWGRPVLFIDLVKLRNSDLKLAQAIRLCDREARLRRAVPVWLRFEALLDETVSEGERQAFFSALMDSGPGVLVSAVAWDPIGPLRRRPFWQLDFPLPNLVEREMLWSQHLNGEINGYGAGLAGHELNTLAAQFRMTAGQIRDAAAAARDRAHARNPHRPSIEIDDLYAGSRAQSQARLTGLAQKLEPRYTWDDIILPQYPLSLLRALAATLRYRPLVQNEWGFERQYGGSKGLVALFAGPSGTGKTMSAEIIANALRLDLFKIDLSSVVSKYIGETEKNLERIFTEAQAGSAILFFDEADALFGKRAEVRDAHDRYANIETAYLLQRTETYDGLVILATNLKKNMDEAFVRRMHFIIDFPFPEEADRLAIWQHMFPPQAPRAGDNDLRFLARKFKLAGGNIRNCVITAAYLAAEEDTAIAMRHLVRATAMELQKMGKLVHEGDFAPYYEMLRS